MNFNKHFRIVLQPKDINLHGKRRFAVGAYSLFKYVGQENANKALQRAISSMTDKLPFDLDRSAQLNFTQNNYGNEHAPKTKNHPLHNTKTVIEKV